MRVVEFLDSEGQSPFGRWFQRLDALAAAKVATALARVEAGNLSGAKSVGGGVIECRIDWGPGYRVYFGRRGDERVILLAGGTKKRQQDDIRDARMRWDDYLRRRKGH